MIWYILLTVALQVLIAVSQNAENDKCYTPENSQLYAATDSLEKYVVRCNQGFELLGPEIMFCLNGEWDKPPPVCQKSLEPMCEDLRLPVFGRKQCDRELPVVGTSCKIRCMKNYVLKGAAEIHCREDLTWSAGRPRCIRECPIPPPLLHGTVIDCSDKPLAGSTCRFRCNSGYVLEGPANLFCNSNGKLLDEEGQERYPSCTAINQPVSSRSQTDQGREGSNLDQRRLNQRDNYNQRRNPSNSCGLNNGGCSQRCILNNGVPRCWCNKGYWLLQDKRTCGDINECAIEPHVCDHKCQNTFGGYQCYCYPGYELNAENKCETRHTVFSPVHQNRRYNTATNRVYSLSELAATPIVPARTGDQENNFQEEHRHQTQYSSSRDNPCLIRNGGCQHFCQLESGIPKCLCNPGYMPNVDGRSCTDINECTVGLHNCEYRCHNTIGSFKCSCPPGYARTSSGKCEDIDECAQETKCHHVCHNTLGSYTCSCLPGYILTLDGKCEGCRKNSYRSEDDTHCTECPPNSYTDSEGKTSISDCHCYSGFVGNPGQNIPCDDIDECADDNYGCSDRCINTPGGVHCSCPAGFEIKEDGKTCGDIDECSIKNGGCQGICNNAEGNFSCSCLEGYVESKMDRYSCDDIDECHENNGGCKQGCVNYPGGYHCTCNNGYRLSAGKKTCLAIQCPRLPVPHYSELRCKDENATLSQQNRILAIRNLDGFLIGSTCKIVCSKGFKAAPFDKTIVCQEDGTWNDTLPECKALQCPPLMAPENGDIHPPACTSGLISVKQKCTFTCHQGYRLQGDPVATCKNNLTWSLNKPPKCLPVKVMPSISCPYDITVDLNPQENSANVTIPRPKTNVEEIEISPEWVNIGQTLLFPAGKTDIKFTAVSPTAENSSDTCIMSVIVLDKEPPILLGCPEFIEVQDAGVYGIPVTWQEPEAIDNVAVESITKSIEPNSTLTPGVHIVEYVAKDAAGNIGSCSFEINVTKPLCSDLQDPENGEANCMDWMLGKLCQPYCNTGYIMNLDENPIYTCDESGVWNPNGIVPPCLKYFPTVNSQCDPDFEFRTVNETGESICVECPFGTKWSPTSGKCEEE